MKIVFVGPQNDFIRQLKRSFTENNQEIFHINDRQVYIIPFLKDNIFLIRLIRKVKYLKIFNNYLFRKKLIRFCGTIRPDCLFVVKGITIDAGTIVKIKSMGIITVNWFLDNIRLPEYHSWFLETARAYDYFLSFDSSVESYRDTIHPHLYYIPVGIDAEFLNIGPISDADKKKYVCNVCFVGAYSLEREKMLLSVRHLGLKIFGWKGWEKSSLAEFYGGFLSVQESMKLYQAAKICINMNTHPPVNGVNLKTFEIPVAGGFQLSDYRIDIERLFTIGREVEIFSSEDELLKKVLFYLEHDDVRENIAQAGKERVLKNHTLHNRVVQILDIINKK